MDIATQKRIKFRRLGVVKYMPELSAENGLEPAVSRQLLHAEFRTVTCYAQTAFFSDEWLSALL